MRIIVLLSLASMLYFTPASAAELQYPTPTRFKVTQEDDQNICKYANSLNIDISDKIYPPIFQGIKAAYITEYVSKELQGNPVFKNESLAQLAGCIIEKRHKKRGRDIPLYLPRRKYNFREWTWPTLEDRWPETADKDNLFIQVSLDLARNELFRDKVIIFTAHYYRKDFVDKKMDATNLGPICTQLFPLTEDQGLLLKQLSNAALLCLNNDYSGLPKEKDTQ